MGDHPNGPSESAATGVELATLIQQHPHEFLGAKVAQKYPNPTNGKPQLPFPFKVLSFDKALPLQAHPDKKLAAQLFEDEEKKHVKEIQDQMFKCQQAMLSQREGESEEETLQRAMRDPEVAVRFVCSCLSVSRISANHCALPGRKSWPILSCSPSCSRRRATRPRCRTT